MQLYDLLFKYLPELALNVRVVTVVGNSAAFIFKMIVFHEYARWRLWLLVNRTCFCPYSVIEVKVPVYVALLRQIPGGIQVVVILFNLDDIPRMWFGPRIAGCVPYLEPCYISQVFKCICNASTHTLLVNKATHGRADVFQFLLVCGREVILYCASKIVVYFILHIQLF